MTTESYLAVIGLGANLGAPLSTFGAALQQLERFVELRAHSAVYLSAAIGPPQPDYHNAAVLGRLRLSPLETMTELLAVEQRCGRQRRERWGPRTLDLDLLWIDGQVVEHPELSVPHPRLVRRAFALRPLLDVAPAAREPSSGRPYTSYLTRLSRQPLRPLRDVPAPWIARG